MFTKILTLAASAILIVAVSGCAGEPKITTTTDTVEQVQAGTIMYEQIIDVRTVEEWNQGRIEGAVRIGIEAEDFTAQLNQLDKSDNYFVYCRSGNRAGQAIEIMRSIGFTGELVNGGSVEEASSMLNANIVK